MCILPRKNVRKSMCSQNNRHRLNSTMLSYTYNTETLITKINATPYESASVYFKEGFCY